MPWGPVLAVIAANWAMKASGPLALGDRRLGARPRRVIALMAPVLLTGLIVTELAGDRWAHVDPAQVAGVATAGVVRLLRGPMLVAVVCGAAAAAVLRQFG